jgi:cytochrome b involved in lipid metabolism
VDQGGKDATEAFEDVSHSEEARQILDKLVIGILDKTVSFQVSRTLQF